MSSTKVWNGAALEVYDLRSDIPSGIEMRALSLPIFDGKNYFRKPEKSLITINFKDNDVNQKEYFGIRFQIYSPVSKVRYIVKINGQVVDVGNSPKGKLPDIREVGIFSQSKSNVFNISYECDEKNCLKYISQYWTQIIRAPAPKNRNTITVGLKTQRWYIDVPENKIHYGGLSGQSFDGRDYYRNIGEEGFYLKIPQIYHAINTSFAIYSQEKFKVQVMVDDEIVNESNGSKEKGISVSVPLYKYKNAQRVIVKIECSSIPNSCARLYNTQLSLSEKESIPLFIPLALCFIFVSCLVWLLIVKNDGEKI